MSIVTETNSRVKEKGDEDKKTKRIRGKRPSIVPNVRGGLKRINQ
jgi:hypothetical protein